MGMESCRSSTSASSSSFSVRFDSFDFGDQPPISEYEEIPSRRWLPDSLRSTPPRSTRIAPAEKARYVAAAPRPSAVNRKKYSPPEYRGILERAVVPVEVSTYEELYERLCREPILLDDGKKSFGLEKSTGKACYMLSAGELKNEWGLFLYNGNWKSLPKSRFPRMANYMELLNDAFRIFVEVDTGLLSPQTIYAAYLVFRYKRSLFQRRQIVASVTIAGLVSKRAVWLEHSQRGEDWGGPGWTKKVGDFVMDAGEQPSLAAAAEPRERGDGWMEVELGEFDVGHEGEGEEVRICLGNAQRLYTERFNMAVEGIEVRPKEQGTW